MKVAGQLLKVLLAVNERLANTTLAATWRGVQLREYKRITW